MGLKREKVEVEGIKFSYDNSGLEMARAYLYILRNSLHKEPVGFLEDVFVDETIRKKGIATTIVREVIDEARQRGEAVTSSLLPAVTQDQKSTAFTRS